ncbi:MAG: hypothetical protein MR966_09015, partial [Lachnospiraceae bacterium]|nr:hypothetical protein [Lachnospiraceae bacterium]
QHIDLPRRFVPEIPSETRHTHGKQQITDQHKKPETNHMNAPHFTIFSITKYILLLQWHNVNSKT